MLFRAFSMILERFNLYFRAVSTTFLERYRPTVVLI